MHLVLDNYCIHSAKETLRTLAELKGKIVLHFLLPYCSDANRIERDRRASGIDADDSGARAR